MSRACTPMLVGVTSPVSEILLLSKTAKFPFQPMDYSPWPSKNLINQNWPKKFMQVGIDVTCMYTNFDRLNFLMTMDYSPWVEREIWSFLKVPISPKPERVHPPKLVCMHVTSIHTCIFFLG